MRRREFIALITVGAAAMPSIAVAQTNKMQRVGILMLGNPDSALFLQECSATLCESLDIWRARTSRWNCETQTDRRLACHRSPANWSRSMST
jgi:hypothetical protein